MVTEGTEFDAIVDSREHETSPYLVQALQNHEAISTVSSEQLPAGDFEIAGIGFEHKQPDDYVSSLLDGRLVEQPERLGQRYEYAYLLFSGNLDVTDGTFWADVDGNAIRASIASLIVHQDNIDGVVMGASHDLLVDMAVQIADQHVRGEDGESTIVYVPEPDVDIGTDTTTMMYACLPNVGPVLASRMQESYPTIQDCIEAARNGELESVTGIGPRTASNIADTLGVYRS